jgi:hypothetical protein
MEKGRSRTGGGPVWSLNRSLTDQSQEMVDASRDGIEPLAAARVGKSRSRTGRVIQAWSKGFHSAPPLEFSDAPSTDLESTPTPTRRSCLTAGNRTPSWNSIPSEVVRRTRPCCTLREGHLRPRHGVLLYRVLSFAHQHFASASATASPPLRETLPSGPRRSPTPSATSSAGGPPIASNPAWTPGSASEPEP